MGAAAETQVSGGTRSDRSRWLEHPWAYFAAMRRGSEPELIRRQIRRWLHAGFTTEELNHAAMLPGSTPNNGRTIKLWSGESTDHLTGPGRRHAPAPLSRTAGGA